MFEWEIRVVELVFVLVLGWVVCWRDSFTVEAVKIKFRLFVLVVVPWCLFWWFVIDVVRVVGRLLR